MQTFHVDVCGSWVKYVAEYFYRIREPRNVGSHIVTTVPISMIHRFRCLALGVERCSAVCATPYLEGLSMMISEGLPLFLLLIL